MIKMTEHTRPPSWRKASYSSNGEACVEVGHDGPAVAVRDTKDPDGPALTFTPAGWQTFTRRVRDGAAGR
jgi:Domain of unknown function (DUF397)